MLGILLFLGIVMLAGAYLGSPAGKGWLGEAQVRLALKLMLNRRDYTVLHNVTIPATMGGTTQIDHVVLSRFGVFIIETKNYGGWIFGGEHDALWTQKLHKRHSQKFQNPLRQNYAHTQSLTALLGLGSGQVLGAVVFVGNSTFKTTMPDNVTYCGELIGWIRRQRAERIPADALPGLLEKITAHRLAPTRATHRQHVANLKARHNAEPREPNRKRPSSGAKSGHV